jgi:phospho-N-acetylmuramoyl-pentapeptide-transferase
MIYHLLYPLHTKFFGFNVFRYITVRAAYAGITALILSFILGPKFIRFLSKRQFFAGIREKGIPSQEKKEGVIPTMGGLLILATVTISSLLWVNLKTDFIWIVLFVFIGLGGVGFWDDMMKLRKRKGIRPIYKILCQIAIGVVVGIYAFLFPKNPYFRTYTSFLFLKNIFVYLGIFYIPFIVLVIVGTSNSTNLADGLDGLAIGLIGEVAFAYAVLAYVVGNIKISDYLNILYVPGSGELVIFLSAIVGSALGFLWYNMHPAQIIMGDTGALALGGAIGATAVLIKQEILLLIAGGVFVMEALSVILQVTYFRRTGGKRLFLMTPIHHHYEKKGIPEEKIVIRFWVIGILFLLAALSTLKIR